LPQPNVTLVDVNVTLVDVSVRLEHQ